MAIKRITLSVPGATAARIRRAAGKAPVSAWVTAVLEQHMDDAELELQWEQFCRDVAPAQREVRRAETLFARLTGASRRRGAA